MKKTLTVLMMVLFAAMLFVSCDNKGKEPASVTYSVGDKGPAGGFIFYDCDADNDSGNADGLISTDCGWRYLEAASADLTGTYTWGNDGSFGTTENGIGTGKSNTKILAEKGADYQAANAVWGKTIDGYSDWFLPSKDELNLMYTNLHQNKKGSFDSSWYWSSSEDNISYAWTQNFDDGKQDYYPRNTGMSVRPIRAFL